MTKSNQDPKGADSGRLHESSYDPGGMSSNSVSSPSTKFMTSMAPLFGEPELDGFGKPGEGAPLKESAYSPEYGGKNSYASPTPKFMTTLSELVLDEEPLEAFKEKGKGVPE